MLLAGQFRVFGAVVDLFEGFFRSREGVKSTLPDDGIGGLTAGDRREPLTSREETAKLQVGELLLQGLELLFVGREILLNKSQHDGHGILLR